MSEEQNRFSLRKLSVGLASVLIGVSIFGTSQTVKADTVADNQTSSVTNNAQSSDTQENKNVAKSTFSSITPYNNVKSNLIQTQVEGKKDQKQVQTENGQQDFVSKTQEATDSNDLQQKDAEKDIVRTSSLQESNNQSNTVTEKTVQHDTLESGQKAQSFYLPKNRQKLAKKVLATNLIETNSSPMTNGGFDEATWGKLDVNDWQGSVQDGLYQLTDYTGDPSHIIVPNEADFEKAGKSTNGLQVGITSDTAHSLLSHGQTFAFSKTNNKKVKAIGTDWSYAFETKALSKFDGSNLDVSSITNMSYMFAENPNLIDVKPIANWNISNVDVVNDYGYFFLSDTKLNLTNINNTPLMQGFLKKPNMLQGATFITNNADLVKATINKDLPTLTNTAKRTIVFNIPHTAPETIVQIINYKATAPAVQVNFDSDSPQIIKTYPVKESDWQLDTSKQNDAIIVNGQIHFKSVKIPHINGYKAHLVRNKINPAMLMFSFVAVPSETKPSAHTDKPNNSAWSDLDHKVVDGLNADDSGWTMPENTSTYTVEAPADDATIDLSDLVIAQPVHAQTTTQIRVTKRFKLSKKHSIKHLSHRKKAVKSFKKYRL